MNGLDGSYGYNVFENLQILKNNSPTLSNSDVDTAILARCVIAHQKYRMPSVVLLGLIELSM